MKFITEFLFNEFKEVKLYFLSALIGAAINSLQGHDIFGAWEPYLVPLLALSLTKALSAYRHRERDLIARMPEVRSEPVFVTEADGQIMLGAGKGWNTITTAGIGSLGDLFGAEATNRLLDEMVLRQEGQSEDCYFSPAMGKTYHVHYCMEGENWLVWLSAVSSEELKVSA
ncbi:hypothetical protein AB9P05_15355 [Roseivirga sp. BDSF3-8]|uniref:hypothetical protein n=1 Tax=Roseivirga sp. BDSF3-8 TaxID=3241598 RepID=UPI003532742F